MLHRHILAAFLVAVLSACATQTPPDASGVLVLQSDFGRSDGAVGAMHGVALTVDRNLVLDDLTHDIPPFDVWAGAYRLHQAAAYYPAGTVFVSVVDPGVGTERRSVVARIGDQYFVTPDNGTLSLVAGGGIDALREIDEAVNRIRGSTDSHTFHGRDVYAFTGARLASGHIDFEGVGRALDPRDFVSITLPEAFVNADGVTGAIPILDVRYGNVWTNIGRPDMRAAGIAPGSLLLVRVLRDGQPIYTAEVPFTDTFADVAQGAPLAYVNSLEQLALALNQGSFAATHGIHSGPGWQVVIRRLR